MARQGISYEQVAAAADALIAEQLKPTLTAVRERLGTGSMNTIHRHLSTWQAQQKPMPRKISEPNARLLAALGAELSKVADEAAADAEAALAQALGELAVIATNGEALEAERDELAQQLVAVSTERDTAAGKAAEQTAEITRLSQDAVRQQEELASVRQALARAELRLEAVPRLEAEVAALRTQLASEQSLRAGVEKAAAVAEAQRVAEEAARQRAELRLGAAETREAETRKDLVEAHAAYQAVQGRLTEAVGLAAGAQAELKELRAHLEGTSEEPVAASNQTPREDQASPSRAGGKSRQK
ncbi:DNA-binding protein (plasmid) [Cupriavidus pinatubonensis]|uniref:DNA-binding protein n=1 Tax=Cupriavidus pinatubonensis TaxID=248026 RepID=UPI001C734040|nr:DNA-binding protein [Cupriavidus pinatubonensis]QYY33556.1 DNA-binding protein [Cupriavidus pinatubonensis]